MKKNFVLVALLVVVAVLFCACSPGLMDGDYIMPSGGSYDIMAEGENYQYDEVVENDFISPAEEQSSYFSLDRNTASYSLMRREITDGYTVAANSVRVEEYINYFNYNYPRPTDGQLAISGKLFDCPWNGSNKLLTIGVAAEEVEFQEDIRNNIVFLIDTSGSMYGSDRLPLIQQAFTMMLDSLSAGDRVSIVTYASGTNVALEGASGDNKTHIANVLQDLQAGGSTFGSGGIQLAYKTAEKFFIEGGNNIILLATDGDFNVGVSDKNSLKKMIDSYANKGISLTVLGVGMMNTNDSFLSTLSANGQYAYLDSISEARKVLVEELGGTFNVVAKDAKAGVTFNPDVVQSYRLIGYENKMITEEEFEDSNTNAGEIGSGHTVTAVYEISLKEGAEGQIATAEVRYKTPEDQQDRSVSATFSTADYTTTPDEDAQFISCVVEYALLLRQSAYKGDATFDAVIARLQSLQSVTGQNADQFRQEFLQLVQKAQEAYRNQ